MAALRPTTYAELRPEVQAIVDRTARKEAKRLGIPLGRARELLAARVMTTSPNYRNGKGH